jgi:hypothetical protein
VTMIDANTTHILSQVQRIVNTGQGYEVRTTTHVNSGGTVESTTSVYTVYDKSLRTQSDPYTRVGSIIDTIV